MSIKSANKQALKTILIMFGSAMLVLWALAVIVDFATETAEADSLLVTKKNPETLTTVENNSLVAKANPNSPIEPIQTIKMVVTGYSSTHWQTDDTPFITASGSNVRDGVVANNLLPFGTKVRIPELYGDKVFVIEDRMHWKKGYYHLDIWFPETNQAVEFGAKNAYIEVLEN